METALKHSGLKVWIDEAEINVGDSLVQKVSEGIYNTDYIGAVISRNSVSSTWVQEELSLDQLVPFILEFTACH